MQNARAVNMPKDRVEAAIKRASGRDATNYQQVLYEGYAPHGVALLIETATDNPTRTVASVRSIMTKHGGNLATSGSVSFLFNKMGVFRLDPAGIDQDDLELYLMDHGLEEMGEGTGEKGEPQSSSAARSRTSASFRRRWKPARSPRSRRSMSTSAPCPPRYRRRRLRKCWS
jgi:transcriptional/translational regulatory protein YebC/TACO1